MFIPPDAEVPLHHLRDMKKSRRVLLWWPLAFMGSLLVALYTDVFTFFPTELLAYMYVGVLVDSTVCTVLTIICIIDWQKRQLILLGLSRVPMVVFFVMASMGWLGNRMPASPTEAFRDLGL